VTGIEVTETVIATAAETDHRDTIIITGPATTTDAIRRDLANGEVKRIASPGTEITMVTDISARAVQIIKGTMRTTRRSVDTAPATMKKSPLRLKRSLLRNLAS
jgi:hypothetical protein